LKGKEIEEPVIEEPVVDPLIVDLVVSLVGSFDLVAYIASPLLVSPKRIGNKDD